MKLTINKSDKYYITGKIIKIGNSTLTISVTSPFVGEIEFYCSSEHYVVLHPPISSKYNWMDLDNTHPNVTEASAYYNTRDKCFYTKESGRKSEWEPTDFEHIYNDNPSLFTENRNIEQQREKYWFFQDRYMAILQKEQLCGFSAYVIRKEDSCSVYSQQVERYPNDYDYFWIYDPDTFRAEKWDTKSIGDLVKEIRPSRDCLKQLLKSYEWDTESIDDLVEKIRPSREIVEYLSRCYEEDDEKAKREERKRKRQEVKLIPKRVEDFLRQYHRLLWLIITLGMFLVGIGSLIVSYLSFKN